MPAKQENTRKKPKVKPAAESSSEEASGNTEQPGTENMEQKFEEELLWCIDQLQLGLETQNPSSRQAVESTKILKILTSSKAPVIKKRQVMRNTFGDYRKKMKEMQVKSAAAARNGIISAASSKVILKSTFFKKSTSKNCEPMKQSEQNIVNQSENSRVILDVNQSRNGETLESGAIDHACESTDETSLNSNFRFNFSLSEKGDNSEAHLEELDSEQSQNDVIKPSVFVKSENNFKFNFPLPD